MSTVSATADHVGFRAVPAAAERRAAQEILRAATVEPHPIAVPSRNFKPFDACHALRYTDKDHTATEPCFVFSRGDKLLVSSTAVLWDKHLGGPKAFFVAPENPIMTHVGHTWYEPGDDAAPATIVSEFTPDEDAFFSRARLLGDERGPISTLPYRIPTAEAPTRENLMSAALEAAMRHPLPADEETLKQFVAEQLREEAEARQACGRGSPQAYAHHCLAREVPYRFYEKMCLDHAHANPVAVYQSKTYPQEVQILHPSVSPDNRGGVRITDFSLELKAPTGHREFATREEAVRNLSHKSRPMSKEEATRCIRGGIEK